MNRPTDRKTNRQEMIEKTEEWMKVAKEQTDR